MRRTGIGRPGMGFLVALGAWLAIGAWLATMGVASPALAADEGATTPEAEGATPTPTSLPAASPESAPSAAATAPAPELTPAPPPRVDPEATFRLPKLEGRLQLSFFGSLLRAGEVDHEEGMSPTPAHPAYGLAWVEARLDMGGRDLGGTPLDFRIDGRARYELLSTPSAFGTAANPPRLERESWRCGGVSSDPSAFSSDPKRCIEAELRTAYFHLHPGRFRLHIGRLLVAEAAGMQVDGARVGVEAIDGFEVGAFGGVLPDRYRRVSFEDYGAAIRPGGGLYAAGNTKRVHVAGSVGAHMARAEDGTDGVRVFAFAETLVRPAKGWDLFAYVLLDIVGPEGFQPRNLSFRIGWVATSFLRLAVTANHYSALAFREYTTHLLEEAAAKKAGVFNTDLLLTDGQDLGLRVTLETATWKVYARARLRRRATGLTAGGSFTELGFSSTVGLLAPDIASFRVDLSATYLSGFQSRGWLLQAMASRPIGKLLEVDVSFVHHRHKDDVDDADNGREFVGPFLTYWLDTSAILFLGKRGGTRFSLLASYQLLHDGTSTLGTSGGPGVVSNPSWYHALFVRTQLRW